MKYGMRERISGAVILLALAVIFIPMLFDDPPPRSEQPEPMMSIEQPIDVERQPVDDPEPPASLAEEPASPASQPDTASDSSASVPDALPQASTQPEPGSSPDQGEVAPESDDQPAAEVQADPIAEIARERDEPAPSEDMPAVAENGEWTVQVGSFGEPGNAERLEKQLDDQGFTAYRQPRDNNLTTVYVGPFASSEAGEKARTQLKEKANIQGLLIRTQEGE